MTTWITCANCGSEYTDGTKHTCPTVTSPTGAKQSALRGAWYLLDSELQKQIYEGDRVVREWNGSINLAVSLLQLREGVATTLKVASLLYDNFSPRIVAEVMEVGVAKYGEDNWRGLSVNEHINHAIAHFEHWRCEGPFSWDEMLQDENYRHFICRAYMAVAVALRPDFYGKWKPTTSNERNCGASSYRAGKTSYLNQPML